MFNSIKDKIRRRREERITLCDHERRIAELEKQLTELSKRTISQRTTEEEVVPFSQVVDEWLNGAEETENGN